jgi:hypothetical protein
MTEDAVARIRTSLDALSRSPGRPKGTRGLVRETTEIDLPNGVRATIAADVPAGTLLDVVIEDVGRGPGGRTVVSPIIVEADTRRPISCGPTTFLLDGLIVPAGPS